MSSAKQFGFFFLGGGVLVTVHFYKRISTYQGTLNITVYQKELNLK